MIFIIHVVKITSKNCCHAVLYNDPFKNVPGWVAVIERENSRLGSCVGSMHCIYNPKWFLHRVWKHVLRIWMALLNTKDDWKNILLHLMLGVVLFMVCFSFYKINMQYNALIKTVWKLIWTFEMININLHLSKENDLKYNYFIALALI